MVLIDGHNVLHLWRRHAREPTSLHVQLASRLTTGRYFRREVVLVCDGNPPPGVMSSWASERERLSTGIARGVYDDVVVMFSGQEEEADDVIERLLASSRRPAGLLVVSGDRRVQNAAKSSGASVMAATALVARLDTGSASDESPGARPAFAEAVPLTKAEVMYWLAQLGVDGEGVETAKKNDKHLRGEGSARKEIARIPAKSQEVGRVDMEYWLRLYPPSGGASGGTGKGRN